MKLDYSPSSWSHMSHFSIWIWHSGDNWNSKKTAQLWSFENNAFNEGLCGQVPESARNWAFQGWGLLTLFWKIFRFRCSFISRKFSRTSRHLFVDFPCFGTRVSFHLHIFGSHLNNAGLSTGSAPLITGVSLARSRLSGRLPLCADGGWSRSEVRLCASFDL